MELVDVLSGVEDVGWQTQGVVGNEAQAEYYTKQQFLWREEARKVSGLGGWAEARCLAQRPRAGRHGWDVRYG